MKSIEQQLTEKEAELQQLRKSAGAGTIKQKLSESGLPPIAKDRLRKRFEKAGTVEGLDRAITEERDYVRQVRAQNGRRGNIPLEESGSSMEDRLVEGYKAIGLSDAEARVAAGIEGAVHTMKESETKLYGAAKAMGMTDAEAKLFASPVGSRLSSW